jgi:Skp family chaperone for outer membrane proteins
MKKRILFAGMLVATLLASGVFGQQPDLFNPARGRVVFVNMEQVFEGFYKTRLAKSRVELQQKDVEAEKQIMVDEMTMISDEVDVLRRESRDLTLSEDIRGSKRILYEEKLMELREKEKERDEFVSRREKQLQVQVGRMSRKIMDEIQEALISYAKQNGLMAVIDNSQRGAAVGVFIYTHGDVDITSDILNLLNSKRPGYLDEDSLFDAEESFETEPSEE